MDNNNDLSKLDYPGELTLEALATLDKYISSCCNTSETSRRLNKKYIQVRKYLKQPYVREIFQLHLMRKGVTPEKIASVIEGGINAVDKVGLPDWLARHKFTQLAAEIFEVLKYNAKEAHINTNILVQFSPEEKTEYEKLRSEAAASSSV